MDAREKKYYQGNDINSTADVKEYVHELLKDSLTYERVVQIKAWEFETLNSLFAEVPVQSFDDFCRTISREKLIRYLEFNLIKADFWGTNQKIIDELNKYYAWLDTRGSKKKK